MPVFQRVGQEEIKNYRSIYFNLQKDTHKEGE